MENFIFFAAICVILYSRDNRTHSGFIHALNQISPDIIPKIPKDHKEEEKENSKLLDGMELDQLKNM